MMTDEALAKLSEEAWRSHVILAMETLNARMDEVEQAMREARSEFHQVLAMRASFAGSETLAEAVDRLKA